MARTAKVARLTKKMRAVLKQARRVYLLAGHPRLRWKGRLKGQGTLLARLVIEALPKSTKKEWEQALEELTRERSERDVRVRIVKMGSRGRLMERYVSRGKLPGWKAAGWSESADWKTGAATRDGAVVEPVVTLDAAFCEHANENPGTCRCPPNCYCRSHTCKNRKDFAR